MGKFENLNVWRRSKDLAINIYKVTNSGTISKDFGLRDQIRNAAVSIPSNIAEGEDLDSDKQAIRHFYIARGSAAELYTQLIIAKEIGYLDNESNYLTEECRIISAMLHKLISSRIKD